LTEIQAQRAFGRKTKKTQNQLIG